MSNNYASDNLDIRTCSDFEKIDGESFDYSNSEEDFQIEDNILEYNEIFEKLGFDIIKNEGKKEIFSEDLLNGGNIINYKSEQKLNISDSEEANNTCIKKQSPKSINEKEEELEKKNDINDDTQPKQSQIDKKEDNLINISKENNDGGKIKDKKIKIKRKRIIKKNIIRHKGKKKKLIEENKINKFISLKLFNPKGETEEYKKIREEIDKIIAENKSVSELLLKKPLETKKIFFTSNEKIIENPKIKKNRKEDPDNIRKKIKQKFLNSLKNRINIKLKIAKSEYLFDFFPQIFVSNINKRKNKIVINKKLIELLNTNFFEEYKNKNYIKDKDLEKKKVNEKKYKHNLEVIEYLEKNENIREKINFDFIKEMTFGQLFKEYLESREFEKDNLKLKQKEKPEYFKNYIIKAYTFVEYFSE
jgi:hypothetical protein